MISGNFNPPKVFTSAGTKTKPRLDVRTAVWQQQFKLKARLKHTERSVTVSAVDSNRFLLGAASLQRERQFHHAQEMGLVI